MQLNQYNSQASNGWLFSLFSYRFNKNNNKITITSNIIKCYKTCFDI